MPVSTSRLALDKPLTSDAATELRTAITTNANILDAAVVTHENTISNRPAAGNFGFTFYATDTKQWYLDDGTSWNVWPVGARGATNIATSESRTNTAYGTLATPDQVTGIVLPSNGLITVWYQATWKESVGQAARAAIFLNGIQLGVPSAEATTLNNPSALIGSGGPNQPVPLFSFQGGLASVQAGVSGYPGDATTGQIVGCASEHTGAFISYSVGTNTFTGSADAIYGGLCYIFAAAGTYTVAVMFKASSGSVTASNRKLWVEAKPFG